MASITIEQLTIPYKKVLLEQWKQKDPEIVPSFMLAWGGPGISHGYGFGEWMAEKYFRENGFYVFTNDFNLVSNTKKFKRLNIMIESLFSQEQLKGFIDAIKVNYQRGYTVENPDLFVFDSKTYFFAEVKKGKDKLRDPQARFIYLAEKFLGVESKLIYLCDKSTERKNENLTYSFEV